MNKKIIVFSIMAMVLAISLFFIFFDRGALVIKASPEDSTIKIGNNLYPSNKEIKLKPGEYDVLITRAGFTEYLFTDVQIKRFDKTNLKRFLASENEKRLQEDLPFDDGLTFKILLRDDGEKFIYDIGLYSFVNRDSQLEGNQEEMKLLKKEALDYIKGYQVDPGKININWLQKEAKEL